MPFLEKWQCGTFYFGREDRSDAERPRMKPISENMLHTLWCRLNEHCRRKLPASLHEDAAAGALRSNFLSEQIPVNSESSVKCHRCFIMEHIELSFITTCQCRTNDIVFTSDAVMLLLIPRWNPKWSLWLHFLPKNFTVPLWDGTDVTCHCQRTCR